MDKPIAWYDPTNGMVSTDEDCPLFTPLGQVWPLYPQRTWVGLTDEDKSEICDMTERDERDSVMRFVEAKLKARNI